MASATTPLNPAAPAFPPPADPPCTSGSETLGASCDPQPALSRNILLCTDFSLASRAALRTAATFCKPGLTRLTVLHVCEFGPIAVTTDEGIEQVAELMRKQYANLSSVVLELRALGVEAQPVFLDGSAPRVILSEIQRRRIDLAVLGTSAHKGVERLIFGSTAESVFRKAPCPVLTVGPLMRPAVPSIHPGPILFATDFGESSIAALRHAAALAAGKQVPLHCIHVLPLHSERRPSSASPAAVANALTQFVATFVPAGVQTSSHILYGTDVPQSVVTHAGTLGAEVIVLGVRRKPGLSTHLPPQRTYRIIMTAPCPVLTLSCEQKTPIAFASGSS